MYPILELLGHMVALVLVFCLFFKETSILFSIVVVLLYVPTISVLRVLFWKRQETRERETRKDHGWVNMIKIPYIHACMKMSQ
jgi:hypothetical protein